MDCLVRGFHLIVKTHVGCGGYSSRGCGSVATLLKLNSTRDIELARGAGAGIVDDVQASLGFEASIELVKQFADFGG